MNHRLKILILLLLCTVITFGNSSMAESLISQEQGESFFEENRDVKFHIDIEGAGEKLALEYWNEDYYYSRILGLFISKEEILDNPAPYHLLSRVESMRFLWIPVPMDVVRKICIFALGSPIAYVGVQLIELTENGATFKVDWLDDDMKVFRTNYGTYEMK